VELNEKNYTATNFKGMAVPDEHFNSNGRKRTTLKNKRELFVKINSGSFKLFQFSS